MAPTTEETDFPKSVETNDKSNFNRYDLLNQIQKLFLDNCKSKLPKFTEAVDEALFKQSQEARSNFEELQLFEASKLFTKQKDKLCSDFLYHVADKFGLDNRLEHVSTFLRVPSHADEFTLLNEKELEKDLAIKNMCSDNRARYKEALYQLTQRLNVLYPDTKVTEDNNPLDPKCLASIFVNLVEEHYEAQQACRKTVYQAFNGAVLGQLEGFYKEANERLIAAGVLPKLKKLIKKPINPTGPGKARSTTANAGVAVSGGGGFGIGVTGTSGATGTGGGFGAGTGAAGATQQSGVFADISAAAVATANLAPLELTQDRLTALMSGIKAEGGVKSYKSGTHTYNLFFYSDNPGPVIDKEELYTRLGDVQQSIAIETSENLPSNVVPIAVGRVLAKNNPDLPNAIREVEEDTINLVSIFFDKILEDTAIPAEIQSLICRLQIPLLKVAIRDRQFLTNTLHPARQLVNKLAEIGLTLDNSKNIENDPVYKKLLATVTDVVNEYHDYDGLYEHALQGIDEFVEKEKRRTKVLEKRTQLAEEGKAQLAFAKQQAEAAVTELLGESDPTETVRSFLSGPWHKLLTMTFLRQGFDSEQSQALLDLTAEFIHFATDDNSLSIQAEPLLGKLFDALATTISSDTERHEQLSTLRRSLLDNHSAAEDDESELDEIELSAEDEAAFMASSATPVHDAAAPVYDENPETESAVAPNHQSAATVEDSTDSAEPKVATAVERQKKTFETIESTYAVLAKNMPEGTWLWYKMDRTNKYLACKLSKKLNQNLYLFVNRMGVKTRLVTSTELAFDLQSQYAQIMDKAPFFDRFMTLAIEQLQSFRV